MYNHLRSDADTFLDHSQVIWSQAMGDPKTPAGSSSRTKIHTEKLHGKYSWPVKVAIPRRGSFHSESISLPISFRETRSRVDIHYETYIRIRRSALRVHSKWVYPQSCFEDFTFIVTADWEPRYPTSRGSSQLHRAPYGNLLTQMRHPSRGPKRIRGVGWSWNLALCADPS